MAGSQRFGYAARLSPYRRLAGRPVARNSCGRLERSRPPARGPGCYRASRCPYEWRRYGGSQSPCAAGCPRTTAWCRSPPALPCPRPVRLRSAPAAGRNRWPRPLGETRDARIGALGEENIPVAVGIDRASLIAEDRRVGARHMIHVRHLLRVPPPIGPRSALVIRGCPEVHGCHIDHVPIEVLEIAVLSAAAIPTQFCVPVKIAADDLHVLAIHQGAIGPDGLQILHFMWMRRLSRRATRRWTVDQSQVGRRRRRLRRAREDLLPQRAMVETLGTVVGRPHQHQRPVAKRRPSDARTGPPFTIGKRDGFGPSRVVQMCQVVFPVTAVARSIGPDGYVEPRLGSYPH